MRLTRILQVFLGSVRWLALVTGTSALFAGAAQAASALPAQSQSSPQGMVFLKLDKGQILLSERGGAFAPLLLGETPEAAELAKLLRQLSPDGSVVAVPVDRLIVADGGMSVPAARSTKSQRQPRSKNR
jgi:hypothetical protein